MNGDILPFEHHVARYCDKRNVDESGDRKRVTGAAFQLREGEEFLSVNWMEHLGIIDIEANIDAVRSLFASKLRLHRRSLLAFGQISDIRNAVDAQCPQYPVSIEHCPEIGDPSHSGIFGLQHEDNMMLLEDTLAEVFDKLHFPAKRG